MPMANLAAEDKHQGIWFGEIVRGSHNGKVEFLQVFWEGVPPEVAAVLKEREVSSLMYRCTSHEWKLSARKIDIYMIYPS